MSSSHHRNAARPQAVRCCKCKRVLATELCKPVKVAPNGTVTRWRCAWCLEELCARAQRAGIPMLDQGFTTIELSKGSAPGRIII